MLVVLVLLLSLSFPSCLGAPWFNGANVPWKNFGADIGGPSPMDVQWFQQFFAKCKANHINSARFWLHCDGRATPQFNADGSVKGLSSTFLSDLTNLANMAKQNEVVLMITLWSFDMFKGSPGLHADLVSDQSKTTSYIQNALNPILKALAGFDNVIYEVMNEPEWAIVETPGNTKVTVPLTQMQRFHGMIAEAVHNAKGVVTTGSSSLKWNSIKVGPAVGNWWNDTMLKRAHDSQRGVLDFYQVHYYDWMWNTDWGYDPAQTTKPASSFWRLDKPTVVGELPSTGGDHYNPQTFMNNALQNGFIGAMFWAYNADWPLDTALPALNSFYTSHVSIASYSNLVSWIQSLKQ
jgi:hypothetical protein